MKMPLAIFALLVSVLALAQPESEVVPVISTFYIDESKVGALHLAPGYATTVRFPEEVTAVILGDPAGFKAEHSESQGHLVLFKPLTDLPEQTNALIVTRSGRQISFHLSSPGRPSAGTPVDFLVVCRRETETLAGSLRESFFIPETVTIPEAASTRAAADDKGGEALGNAAPLEVLSISRWIGKELQGAIGTLRGEARETILPFAVLNRSGRTIELLPPQLQLATGPPGRNRKSQKAETIPLTAWRMTSQLLRPGDRADGIVVYQRPAFKQAGEELWLQLAAAEQVDRPVHLRVPFIASGAGGFE